MREKTGEERLKTAMDLRKLALKLAECGIRHYRTKISKKELKIELQKRIYGSGFPFKNRFTFNIIDNKSGLKIDFWLLKKDAFGKSEFSRKIKERMFGEDIFIISPEDLILCKLMGFEETKSGRRLQDAKSILQTSKVDMKYIRSWAEKQGTIEILNDLLKD